MSPIDADSLKNTLEYGLLCNIPADSKDSESEKLNTWIQDVIDKEPTVTPQEQQTFKWCTDCKEYDQEKHCCHRWSKVIRDTVEEMKQEPFKPMVEIDLYSVIKQKYIKREELDKIRAEIETKYGQCDICEYFEDYDYEENDISEYRPIGNIANILQIIDRYKAESEK